MTDIAAAARRLAHLGHPVLPLHNIRADGRCSCGKGACSSPGKHPRLLHGLLEASSEPAVVVGWWRRWKTANVGLLTGEAAGLLVVDLDGPEGIDSFEQLQKAHEALPPTRWVNTGGGGRHAYLRHPGGHLGNTARKLGAGIDTRGDAGYVVAPPSLHVTGRRYEWANTERAAPCPGWLVELLRPPPTQPVRDRRPGFDRDRKPGCDRRLAGLVTTVATAPMGQRNSTLNWASYQAREIVEAGAELHHVAGSLLHAAQSAGLGETESRRTIESGLGLRGVA